MPMKTIEGYSKEKYTDTSVLLAGGGAKALSDFIGELSWDNTNKKIKYTPVGGNETDLVTLSWDNISGKPINFKAYSGSLASGGWKIMQGNNSSPSIAISYNNNNAAWNSGTYSATLVYGCTDTRGLLDCAYHTPIVTFGGGSYGGSNDNNPAWYMKLSGTNGTTYNLDSMPYASSSGTSSYPAGFDLRLTSTWATTGWNMPGTWITGWGTNSGADIAFAKNGGALNVATDGYFYQGADYGHGLVRVMDDWDRQNTIWSNADKLDGYHANTFYENGYAMFGRTIDASGLDANTWYPVIIPIGAHHTVRIEVRVSLNSNTRPSWSTHEQGFSVRKIWEVNGSGWGTNQINRRILESDYSFASIDPVRGIGQLSNSSMEYVYVRGGGKYYFYVSHNVSCTLYTTTYSIYSQSVGPTTTIPDAISINVGYYCSNAGNANTVDNKHASDFATSGHTHDSRYLRKDTNDSTPYQYSFTKTNGHAIQVGTIRGRAVGSQTGEYIHLYERVAIGSPSGWGSRNAPTYGLATYGGAWLATDTGNVGIGTTSPVTKLDVRGTDKISISIDTANAYRFSTGFKGTLYLGHASHGSGSGVNDGYTDGITFGVNGAAYAGIIVQNSGSYGSRILFTTTDDYSYNKARMILDAQGKLGILTMSPLYTLDVAGNIRATSRIYANEWIQLNSACGLYWPNNNSAYLYANNVTSYAGLITEGSRGGYCGLHCGPNNSYMTVMSTDTHHGLYCENTGTWEFYYNRDNGGVGIRTSSITKNFNVSGQSYLSSNVWIGTTSGGEMLNIGGWVGTTGTTGWYNITYAGGIYMTDSTWIRIYNDKKFYVNNSSYDAIHSAGGVYVAGAVHAYANYLKSTCNDCTITIGSQNSDYCHYETTAPTHWFNKTVKVAGNIYGGSNYDRRLAYCDEIYTYALPYSGWWSSGSGQNVDNANGMTFVYGNHGSPNGWGILCTFDYTYNSGYKFQLFAEGYSAAGMYYRCRSSDRGGWTSWKTVIDSGNIGSQSVNYASSVGINYSNDSNSIYQMLWGSGNYVYGTSGIYCNPYTDTIYATTIKVNRAESTTGFFLTSDFRKKNILGNINEYKAYDFVKNCKPVIYELKDDETHDKQLGLIAQEVEEYFPELVITDENGFKSMDYSRLSVVLFALLKDLMKRNKL